MIGIAWRYGKCSSNESVSFFSRTQAPVHRIFHIFRIFRRPYVRSGTPAVTPGRWKKASSRDRLIGVRAAVLYLPDGFQLCPTICEALPRLTRWFHIGAMDGRSRWVYRGCPICDINTTDLRPLFSSLALFLSRSLSLSLSPSLSFFSSRSTGLIVRPSPHCVCVCVCVRLHANYV